MRHVVLGAAGFIGSHLVDRLSAQGKTTVAVDLKGSAREPSSPGVTWFEVDAHEPFHIEHILEPGDHVYTMTAGGLPDAGTADPRAQLDQTVGAMLRCLEACRRRSVGRVLFPSSGGTVYGVAKTLPIDEASPTDPVSAYGIHKLSVEKYLALYRHLHGLDSIVMRIANPFGPRQDPLKGQGLIAALSHRALNQLPIEIWGDGRTIRDYIYIDDLIDGILCLSDYQGPERLFNIGSGVGASINDIIARLESILSQTRFDIRWKPARAFDAPANILSIDRITSETGWVPRTSLTDGMVLQLDWLRGTGPAPR